MSTKSKNTGCTLTQIVRALESLAPPDLAEAWDNTGLLWAPTRRRRIHRIGLTIDCTPAVVDEWLTFKVDLVVAYHPPWFTPLNKLSTDRPYDHRILRLIEERVAVYSPHTALDHAPGGVNDWLASGIKGKEVAAVENMPEGPGRLISFERPQKVVPFLKTLRQFLRVPYLRVSRPAGLTAIKRVACCAGAGHDAIKDANADVFVTGEMKHHDVLDAQSRGVMVVLSEHTHTERGYLPVFKRRLLKALPNPVEIHIAKLDRDPLELFRA